MLVHPVCQLGSLHDHNFASLSSMSAPRRSNVPLGLESAEGRDFQLGMPLRMLDLCIGRPKTGTDARLVVVLHSIFCLRMLAHMGSSRASEAQLELVTSAQSVCCHVVSRLLRDASDIRSSSHRDQGRHSSCRCLSRTTFTAARLPALSHALATLITASSRIS